MECTFEENKILESSKEKEKFILEITLTFNMYVLLGEVMNFEISSHAFKLCLICLQVMHVWYQVMHLSLNGDRLAYYSPIK